MIYMKRSHCFVILAMMTVKIAAEEKKWLKHTCAYTKRRRFLGGCDYITGFEASAH